MYYLHVILIVCNLYSRVLSSLLTCIIYSRVMLHVCFKCTFMNRSSLSFIRVLYF